jgi:Na+/H+ antiporter NhaD/arsenite permease-like protein
MAIAVARQVSLPAPAILLPMVMASNIGGTATLIGDPPNIMIGSGAGLTFLDFLEHLAIPCLLMLVWLDVYSRRFYRVDYAAARPADDGLTGDVHLSNPVLARWLGVICAGILLGFFTHHATGMPPAVPALLGAAAALVVQDLLYLRRERPNAHERTHGILRVTAEDIEWPTLAFFGFLFIVVGAAVNTGLIGTLARGLEWAIGHGGVFFGLSPEGTLLFAALLVCWVSGILSALIDNIPFVAVAIPVIERILPSMPGNASVLWWALSLGACLGGNGTPIGASANVTTVGMAERAGVRISFGEFARFAVPVTAGTLVIASVYLAAFIYLGTLWSTLLMGAGTIVALAARLVPARRQSRHSEVEA